MEPQKIKFYLLTRGRRAEMADDDDNSCPEPELGGKTILLSPVNTNDAISFSTFFLEASFRIYRVRHLNFD